jgi:hypothetical protein
VVRERKGWEGDGGVGERKRRWTGGDGEWGSKLMEMGRSAHTHKRTRLTQVLLSCSSIVSHVVVSLLYASVFV